MAGFGEQQAREKAELERYILRVQERRELEKPDIVEQVRQMREAARQRDKDRDFDRDL